MLPLVSTPVQFKQHMLALFIAVGKKCARNIAKTWHKIVHGDA